MTAQTVATTIATTDTTTAIHSSAPSVGTVSWSMVTPIDGGDDRFDDRERRQRRGQRSGLERALVHDEAECTEHHQRVGLPVAERAEPVVVDEHDGRPW